MSDIFNNELFEAFASASDNVFIYVCDMKTNISRWSKASVEYFGLSGEYLEDAATIWEQHIHPDDRALYNEDISGVFSGTKPRHECQYRARNRMGEYVWVECKGSVIWDDAGNPIIFAGLMTRLDGQKISISASAGALLFPKNADSREGLITKLEHSLEYAKTNRRGDLVFFSVEIARKHERGLALREDLNQSIKKDFRGFELFFQPFVNPGTNLIAGCECLLRWKGEKIKDSYPMEFIKVLEDYGGIREVGFWVMEQAIKQQVAWRDTYGELQVSFNVSYQQFMDEDFENRLISYVEKYGVNPSYMIIELTESCQVDKPQELASMFDRLRGRGFKVALDDFGTAYASLEMLKCLHVDYIKVEHSFVRELSEPGHDIDYVIIDNLLRMCRRLGYDSIVEGVENGKVADIVGEMDVTLLQGYYYSRPVCRNDFEKLLEEDKQQS